MENKKSLFEKLGLVEKVQTAPEEEAELSISVDEEARESFARRIGATVEKQVVFTPEPEETKETKESFKFDRHNEIGEVYNIYNLKLDGINTIFVIENFLRALPEYLPEDVKRQSLFDIVDSSGMSLENLIKDGSERLKSLNSFFDQFSTNINKNIQDREKEIDMMVKKINQCKSEIEGLQQLKDTQKATIDYEVQKVSNILHFVKPKQ
jgi:hypothetical protein